MSEFEYALRPLVAPQGSIEDETLRVMGGEYTLEQLQEAFIAHDSSYCGSLENMDLRWHLYRWDDEVKRQLLAGEDMDPLRHGIYQARTIGRELVAELPAGARDAFLAYHVMHDWHEGEFARRRNETADVAAHIKTDDIRKQEFLLNISICREIFPGAYNRHMLEWVSIFEGRDPTTGDKRNLTPAQDLVHRYFEGSEIIGYLMTVFQFAELYASSTRLNDQERETSMRLVKENLGRNTSALEQLLPDSRYAKRIIDRAKMIMEHFGSVRIVQA